MDRLEYNAKRREYYKKKKDYFIKKATVWKNNNVGKHRKGMKEYRLRIKHEVLSHYSSGEPICNCCGEKILVFLTIDHIVPINGGKRETLRGGIHLYLWLRQHNYPSGYQVLCYNCNYGKKTSPDCPHKLNVL